MAEQLRLLQTGDWHIGRWRNVNGHSFATDRAEHMIETIMCVAKEQRCDGVLVCGDIFDSYNVSNAEREMLVRCLRRYAGKGGLPIYVIPGNHDLTKERSSVTDFLAELSGEVENLHVAFASEPSEWQLKGVTIVGVPATFSEDQTWVEAWSDNAQEGPYVFMGHAMVMGSSTDSGYRPKSSRSLSLAKASKNQNVLWWAWGDVHTRQALPSLAEGAKGWYAGSPIPMNFGETEDRGVLVIVFEKEEGQYVYRGRKYHRIDDKGFDPIIEVTATTDMATVPDGAILKAPPGMVLSQDRKVVAVTKKDDIVVPVMDVGAFDPVTSSVDEIKESLIQEMRGISEAGKKVAADVITTAVEKFQARLYNET
jgi:hypothetical protein